MAQLTIDIPDNKLQIVLAAFASRYGYIDLVGNPDFNPEEPESETNSKTMPNPENKAQFAKRMVIEEIKRIYSIYKRRELQESIKDDLNDL